jgi:hypothetical protein
MSPADAIAIRQARRARVRTIRRRVIAGAVALFVATWLLITLMLVTGHDPALAGQTTTAQTTSSNTGTASSTGSSTGTSTNSATSSSTGATSTSTGSAGSTGSTGSSGSSSGTSSVTSRQS